MSIIVPFTTPKGFWDSGWDPWATVHGAASATYAAGSDPSATATKGATDSLIKRGLVTADLSSVPGATTIERAKIYIEYCSAKNEDSLSVYGVIVDGSGVPANDGGYDEMMAKTTWLGSIEIPASTTWLGQTKELHLNAAGIAALQAAIGGTLQLGLRMDKDISDTEPDGNEQNYFNWGSVYDLWIVLNWVSGYKWVEGTNFAYLDNYRTKRLKEGTVTGASGDPGYSWPDGEYQYYTDYLGNVRRIAGTPTGLTGKLAGQISVNTKSPMLGTHYCWIDPSGNERCFEGT